MACCMLHGDATAHLAPTTGTPQELIAVQQNGPKALGFFGTRNMGFLHQNLIEILSYAMVLTVSTSCSLPCELSHACPACM